MRTIHFFKYLLLQIRICANLFYFVVFFFCLLKLFCAKIHSLFSKFCLHFCSRTCYTVVSLSKKATNLKQCLYPKKRAKFQKLHARF